eukprot:scaffold273149_cov21-Tisochrysis_lutea.AAC.1
MSRVGVKSLCLRNKHIIMLLAHAILALFSCSSHFSADLLCVVTQASIRTTPMRKSTHICIAALLPTNHSSCIREDDSSSGSRDREGPARLESINEGSTAMSDDIQMEGDTDDTEEEQEFINEEDEDLDEASEKAEHTYTSDVYYINQAGTECC